MENKANNLLKGICDSLGGINSLNYCCEIQIFSGAWLKNESEEKVLKSIMTNNFIVRNIEISSLNAVMSELQNGLNHKGDNGYFPNDKYYGTKKHEKDMSHTISTVQSLFQDASKVFSFYIKDGHPFYPVFWDFSFLLKHGEVAYVFIGSSSD